MSFIQNTKSFLTSEAEKLKKMSFKDKIWYIVEYYKFHIIFTLTLCFIIFSVLINLLTKTEPFYHAAIINTPFVEYEASENLADDLRKHMNYEKEDGFYIEQLTISSGENASPDSYMFVMKLQTLVGAKELDVIISDQAFLDSYSQHGFFANLETTLPAELWEQVKESVVYITDLETQESIPAAIDISNSAFTEKYDIASETTLFSIVSNAPHLENSIASLEYILDLEEK